MAGPLIRSAVASFKGTAPSRHSISTRFLTACPGLNLTVKCSPTMTFSPVLGFRAGRGIRFCTSKTPKLRSSTRPSVARKLMMASRIFWTITAVSS